MARISEDNLGSKPLWFILGSEPLLAIEKQDAIRAAATKQGYTERKSFVFEGNADFSALYEALGDLSLFGEKTIIEVTFPRATIGRNGPAAVDAMISKADENKLIVISLLDWDWTAEKKDWFIKLKKSAQVVEALPIPPGGFKKWIEDRIAGISNQRLTPDALNFLAEKTEGNLLAAKQEIEKLTLLCHKPEITLDDVIDAVSDVSRYDQDALIMAMLQGDAGKVSKIVDSLKAENVPIPSFLWMLADEIRRLLLAKNQPANSRPAYPRFGISAAKNTALLNAANRASTRKIETMLKRLSDVDRLSKGLYVQNSDGDAWQELKAICLLLALKRGK